MKKNYFILALMFNVVLLPVSQVVADDAEQVRSLLSEMSNATRELDYRGLFTFEVSGSLDTYKINHRVEAGQEIETLRRLNGEVREVTRESNVKDCLSPGKQILHELMADLGRSSDLLHNYQYEIHPHQRIAERSATVINLIPASTDRYGYSIGIDQSTKLPLKIVLIAPNRRYLERIQFIELETDDLSGTETANSSNGNVSATSADNEKSPCNNQSSPEVHGWYVAWLPKGFIFSGQRRAATGDEMLSFTDGLASLSIFIGDAQEKPPVREASGQLGATTVYMERRIWDNKPHSVTVVGEIPLVTAQKVAASLNPR